MNVKFYLVGGACRDILIGVTPKDFDFVVVGASPEYFQNYQTVGNDFPVFLQPTHKWEVALARIECKEGVGYTGFTTECDGVTLEEDLSRRDLTCNAIAIEVDWEATVTLGELVTIGTWIDPFNGRQDIKDKVLRHTTESFTEDPLRVLRVARFLSRFGDEWQVADETSWLCYNMADSGTLSELTPERVWLETVKAMGAEKPSLYFEQCLRLNLFEEVNSMYGIPQKPNHHPEVETFLYE